MEYCISARYCESLSLSSVPVPALHQLVMFCLLDLFSLSLHFQRLLSHVSKQIHDSAAAPMKVNVEGSYAIRCDAMQCGGLVLDVSVDIRY